MSALVAQRLLLAIAALLGGLAVAAGAFGAHALGQRVGAEQLAWWETGVRYQLAHALAMMLAVLLARAGAGGAALVAAALLAAGTVIFSGTLYAMTLGAPRVLGAVTPIGGVAMLAGWLVLAWSVLGIGPRG
ncbi:MAG: DUF423 domain-containing protein [Acidobacteria bacterium]|nr:MAG: DUF423 domain-containing protein [Acidobacteriota bacterium]